MKFRITMKDPDGVDASIALAVDDSLEGLAHDLTPRELEDLPRTREEELREKVKQWFEHGEYLTVEVDTEADTCVVVKP